MDNAFLWIVAEILNSMPENQAIFDLSDGHDSDARADHDTSGCSIHAAYSGWCPKKFAGTVSKDDVPANYKDFDNEHHRR